MLNWQVKFYQLNILRVKFFMIVLYTFHTASSGELQQLHLGWRHKTEIPSLRVLMQELRDVDLDYQWFYLGILLKIEHSQLRIIEVNYHRDPWRSLTEMLQVWLRNSPQPTWEVITEALESIGEHALAEKIKAKYCHSLEHELQNVNF